MLKSLVCKTTLILACAFACSSSQVACHGSRARRAAMAGDGTSADTGGVPVVEATPVLLAHLEDPLINESSGIVASRANPGLFWTHNDSGDGPFVYAFDRGGKSRGTWRVEGASARDWEDIACGPGPERGRSYLYAGDIGDNEARREYVVVYRFPEPLVTPGDDASGHKNPHATAPAEVIRLKYPDGPHNAEALLVHPVSGDIYVLTKTADGAGVYKLSAPPSAAELNTLVRVAVLRGPGFFGTLITGGDISPDGRRIALCDYANGYELRLPDSKQDFDEVWRQPPVVVPLGARRQGEAVCYRLDGAALLATSEGSPSPLIEVTLPRAP